MKEKKVIDQTKNLLIVGDNLKALKLLQKTHQSKIKMIYIDPPYNTGRDFAFRDNFHRHSDWLNMMRPRLALARELLSDDGVIFISIDDHEQAHLKILCDEIFGEENFVSNIIWAGNRTGKNDSENIKNIHEYILVYLKNHQIGRLSGVADQDNVKYRFHDARGPYYLITLDQSSLSYSAGMDYPLEHDGVTYYPGIKKSEWQKRQAGHHSDRDWIWRWRKEKVEEAIKNDFLVFKNGRVYTKQYRDFDADGHPVKRTMLMESVINRYSTRGGKDLLKKIFGQDIFAYAKPLPLLKDLISLVSGDDFTVLDYFAGSGTTGHAIMDLNAEDGGQRKFILVQLDEPVVETSEARKAGFSTIDEITAERLRLAGAKIQSEQKDVDVGFQVLRLD